MKAMRVLNYMEVLANKVNLTFFTNRIVNTSLNDTVSYLIFNILNRPKSFTHIQLLNASFADLTIDGRS